MHACESSVHSYQNDKTREDTKDSKVQHTMGADTFCNVSYRDVFSTILHIFVRKGYVIFMFFSLVCSINYYKHLNEKLFWYRFIQYDIPI